MFDTKALAQLNQIKEDILATKDYVDGIVAATSGRFGFVRTDDGRDVFLSPEKMDKLLPGDRVKINVIENDKGKLEAEVEELLSSELDKFVGQYRVKGSAHFVVPQGQKFTRWIFVPPPQRKQTKDNEFVVAKIARHPINDGKAQANILFRIGKESDDFIEQKYVKAKYDLNYRVDDAQRKQCEHIQKQFEDVTFDHREDLTALNFFTIDSASTMDMDDAIALKARNDDGSYIINVAIADPAQFVTPGSALAKHAQACGQTVYLLGGTVPMFPAALSHCTFSLVQNQIRPALVCELVFSMSGDIEQATFRYAKIESKHKLNYAQVSALIDGDDGTHNIPEDLAEDLRFLHSAACVRRKMRETLHLVYDDYSDFEYHLNNRGQIESVSPRLKPSAQVIVEEAMVATNMSAGEFLSKHKQGIHATHGGFREDRIGEVKALLKEEGISTEDLNVLEKHIHLLQHMSANENHRRLIPALRRMMQSGGLSLKSEAHLGMGLEHYATVTSPIRRFTDLYNHWCLHSIIESRAAVPLTESDCDALNETLRIGRQADRELQQWLLCQFAKEKSGESTTGKIRIVTQQGFGVRLNDSGIEGFVLFDKKTEKKFDAKRMTLTINEHAYYIEDEVNVTIGNVDFDKRRISFSLTPSQAPSSS